MLRLFTQLLHRLQQGENAVLCTVIEASGSVPRGAGAKMAVFSDGTQCGTIGGGSVEYHAAQNALLCLKAGKCGQRRFPLHPDPAEGIGMVCGGEVTVLLHFISAENEAVLCVLRHILCLLHENRNSWLILRLCGDEVTGFGTYDEVDGFFGVSPVASALLERQPVYHPGTPDVFAEPLTRKGIVYLFGGGHVGQALCPVLSNVGFRVRVVENRQGYRERERFPQAEDVLWDDCLDLQRSIGISRDDYVVIMTPGHANDHAILDQVLHTPARYIGLMGSRKKIEVTTAFLLSRGHSREAIARVHTPIGLPIAAQTPEEIAVSIAAQLIQERNN